MSEVTIYNEMLGKIFTNVCRDEDTIIFIGTDGKNYKFYHEQDCCEDVHIDDIIGDLHDLLGYPIIEAEEVITYATEDWGSVTHTWYKFATTKGCVTVKWHGSSNGYYSESVNFAIYEQ